MQIDNLGDLDPGTFTGFLLPWTALANNTRVTLSARIPNGWQFDFEDIRIMAVVNTTSGTAVQGLVLPGPDDPASVTTTIPQLGLVKAEILINSTSLSNGQLVPVTLLGGSGVQSSGIGTRGTVRGGEDLTVNVFNGTNAHGTPVILDGYIWFPGRIRRTA